MNKSSKPALEIVRKDTYVVLVMAEYTLPIPGSITDQQANLIFSTIRAERNRG